MNVTVVHMIMHSDKKVFIYMILVFSKSFSLNIIKRITTVTISNTYRHEGAPRYYRRSYLEPFSFDFNKKQNFKLVYQFIVCNSMYTSLFGSSGPFEWEK
jgi:hypothetical protein